MSAELIDRIDSTIAKIEIYPGTGWHDAVHVLKLCREELAKQAERFAATSSVLKEIEWIEVCGMFISSTLCVVCGEDKDNGHNNECRLAELLYESNDGTN